MIGIRLSLATALLAAAFAAHADNVQDRVLAQIAAKTGLKPVTIPDTEGAYLGKTHRGYEVIYTAKAGDVWGRYVARLTMGEIGREAGGLLAYLTGQRKSLGGTVVGSPLDRLLSQQIGQPLSVTIVLKHGKPNAPRLDVLSDYAKGGSRREDAAARQGRLQRGLPIRRRRSARGAARFAHSFALKFSGSRHDPLSAGGLTSR